MNLHVLRLFHRALEVMTLNFRSEEIRIFVNVRDYTIKEDLRVEKGDGRRAGLSIVIKFITTHRHAHSVFFRLEGFMPHIRLI